MRTLSSARTFDLVDSGSFQSSRAARTWVLALVMTGVVACAGSNGSSSGPATATAIRVAGPTGDVARGVPFEITASAIDAAGGVVATYAGTVHFFSSDPSAVLPPDYTFQSGDAGSHQFSVAASTLGDMTLTVQDESNVHVTGDGVFTVAHGLYVADRAANAIAIFAEGATGDAAPLATIAGAATDLATPEAMAVDSHGNVYVANLQSDTVLVFAAGDVGNVAPLLKLGGATTGILAPEGLQLGAADDLYVANTLAGNVLVFPYGAHGDVAPSTALHGTYPTAAGPLQVALDGGGHLFVAYYNSNSIAIYAASASGGDAPLDTIIVDGWGRSPKGATVTSAGRLYVGNIPGNSITIFAPGAAGAATPDAVIAGASTGIDGPWGIALDANGRIYVANWIGNSISIFASNATGDVPPVATISGTHTGLNQPGAIAIH